MRMTSTITNIIRILHECDVRIENCHCLASRGSAEWCKTVIPRDGIFYPHRTLMLDFFFLHTFWFQIFYFKSSIHCRTHWRWRRPFLKLPSLWHRCDVNLTTKLRDVLYNQCKPNSREKFFSGADKQGQVRISIPSENLGNPDLVCKKMFSHWTLQFISACSASSSTCQF